MLPFYDYLSLAYNHGGKAVELFFCISGFVFFMYYFKKIKMRSISPLNFFILFPLLVLLISFLDRFDLLFFKKLSLFGDLSYSIYITHFPIQLIIVTLCVVFNFDIDFYLPISLVAFLTLTFIVSYLSYSFLELPARNYFRKFKT
jgi:peptidoglycan/LPS O-acetylase OafA/YrhL